MLLGNKKTQKTEQNWCVILNPIQGEIDKRIVARKISEAFSLSSEESNDLVNNTPIILVDNITRAVAIQVKDYFRTTGAEMLLTNDIFLKRKCYRTVWPETPSLSFLQTREAASAVEEEMDHEILHPEAALEEIRTMDIPAPAPERRKETVPYTSGQNSMFEEVDKLRKECEEWRGKYESQRLAYEKLRDEMLSRSNFDDITNSMVHDRDRELEKQRSLLMGAEERYEGLQEEYRQARALFEEKVAGASKEVVEWKNKADELIGKLHIVSREKVALEDRMKEQSRGSDAWRQQQRILEDELNALKQSRSEDDSYRKETQKRVLELEQAKESLTKLLKEEETRYHRLLKEYNEIKKLYDQKDSNAEIQAQNLKAEVVTLNEKIKSLERNQTRLIEDLEARSHESREWEIKSHEFEETLNELKSSHENLEKMLQVNLKHLENRERELETARRQIKDMKLQMDQREAVSRRVQLVNQLSEKEARLKDLIRDQEKVENEIREREESIGRILAEQERIEKDIIEGKQAQRHFAEQAKKEKSPRVKINKEEMWQPGTSEDSDPTHD